MDQTIMPGVGNIIKSEGLFEACIFPLRRCKELTLEEARRLINELNVFSLKWYSSCKAQLEGAPSQRRAQKVLHGIGEHHLEKRAYGLDECVSCGQEIYCIKIGS